MEKDKDASKAASLLGKLSQKKKPVSTEFLKKISRLGVEARKRKKEEAKTAT